MPQNTLVSFYEDMKNAIKKAYDNREKDRYAWIETAETFSVEAILLALGFPSDPKSIYYNINTGDEECLDDLLSWNIVGPVKEKDKPYHLAIELENWLPKEGEVNPIMARCIALTEQKVKEQAAEHLRVYAERNKTKSEFLDDVNSLGCTLDDGFLDNRAGKSKITLHDGREFVFSLSLIWDFLKKPRTLELFN